MLREDDVEIMQPWCCLFINLAFYSLFLVCCVIITFQCLHFSITFFSVCWYYEIIYILDYIRKRYGRIFSSAVRHPDPLLTQATLSESLNCTPLQRFFFFFNMATHLFNVIHTFVCVGSEVWVKLVQWVKNAIHLALNIIIPLLTFDSLLLMSVQEEMCSSIHETCPKEQVVFLTLAWYVNIVQVCISCPCYCHLWLT